MTTKTCDEWPKIEDPSQLSTIMKKFPLWELISVRKKSIMQIDNYASQENGVYKLSRSFTAKDFNAALHFIVEAGKIAETRGHHPDFHLTSYRNIQTIVYTHSLGGLTQNDFDLAEDFDNNIVVEYSAKWIKDNKQSLN